MVNGRASLSSEDEFVSSECEYLGHLNFDQKQAQYKWNSNFELFKLFCIRFLEIKEPLKEVINNRSRSIKTGSSTILLYNNTGTIQFQGSGKEEFKSRLKLLLSKNLAVEPDQDQFEISRQNNMAAMKEGGIGDSGQEPVYQGIKDEINKIWDAINRLTTKDSTVTTLERENQDLKSTNKSLRKHILDLEEERDSLRVAMQLLTKELTKVNNSAIDYKPIIIPDDVENKNACPKSDTQKVAKEQRSANVNATRARKFPDTSQKTLTKNTVTHSKESAFSKPMKPVTALIGDSMVKNIQGWKLSNSTKVVVKPFPGANTEDMEDYLKPILRKEPNNVILHIGTNDLKSSNPGQVIDSILSLAMQIKENSPRTDISISAILPRTDEDLSSNISEVNNSLKPLCQQHHWHFIDHSNITTNYLNKGGLHLNRRGVLGSCDIHWVKMNTHLVCFNGRGNRFGSFHNYVRAGLVGAIKLEHVAGHIRCATSTVHNSHWGCAHHGGLGIYAFNAVVTDQHNSVIFPKKQFLSPRIGSKFWYSVPFANTATTKELIFTDFAQPFFFPKYKQMRVWYGEDLTGWTEGDNYGRVCVNVYAKFMN